MKTNAFVPYFVLQTILELVSSKYVLLRLRKNDPTKSQYGFRTNNDGGFGSKKQTQSFQRSKFSLSSGIFHR